MIWSGRRGSNPQPSAWKADTLPVELLPLVLLARSNLSDKIFFVKSFAMRSAAMRSAAMRSAAMRSVAGRASAMRSVRPAGKDRTQNKRVLLQKASGSTFWRDILYWLDMKIPVLSKTPAVHFTRPPYQGGFSLSASI